MRELNYHHLRYFHAIVEEGTLTAAATRLNVSQSAMSVQLKQLEQSLDCALFERAHKALRLTEEGGIVYEYARTIFSTGEELLATLQKRTARYSNTLRVGAVATLSRNFQLGFLRAAIMDDSLEVIIESASMEELLLHLAERRLDLVLSNRAATGDASRPFISQLVDQTPVSLIGPKQFKKRKPFQFPQDLQELPLILPRRGTDIRQAFDRLLEGRGLRLVIAAEADDMAMLRLLARNMHAVALLPPVVVLDELESKVLHQIHQMKGLYENFYAITLQSRFPNLYLQGLLGGHS